MVAGGIPIILLLVVLIIRPHPHSDSPRERW
jgi:hypothetical protein